MNPSASGPSVPRAPGKASAPHPAWPRLTAAARAAQPAVAAGGDDAAPYGFSTRVVARWRQLREEEQRLAVWQRVSWRAAFASLALGAMVVVSQSGGAGASDLPLLEPPSFTLPGW